MTFLIALRCDKVLIEPCHGGSAHGLEQGRIVKANFDSCRMLTLKDALDIDVEIINSGAPIGGVGEIGTPGIAPALGNALFAATGKRLRQLPFGVASATAE